MHVVPYVGTWIEMAYPSYMEDISSVVPYVGTWIEIGRSSHCHAGTPVVPYVGTWIEIEGEQQEEDRLQRRSLRGNVDRNKKKRR